MSNNKTCGCEIPSYVKPNLLMVLPLNKHLSPKTLKWRECLLKLLDFFNYSSVSVLRNRSMDCHSDLSWFNDLACISHDSWLSMFTEVLSIYTGELPTTPFYVTNQYFTSSCLPRFELTGKKY